MSDLILHHYDTSPFSEKIKTILGWKNLRWLAVEQPTIMPKPQLTPLTGGYRRIPVLQIGADVYCDSQLIARVIDALHPQRRVIPDGAHAVCATMSLWADRVFFPATLPLLFALVGDLLPPEFIEDRRQLAGGRIDFAGMATQELPARQQLRACAALLDRQLADGRPFLLGADFSLADAACYHPIWFLRSIPNAGSVFDEFGRLLGWADRIRALGHGQRQDVDRGEALHFARFSDPLPGRGVDQGEAGLATGAQVSVTPDDYGFDPVVGELVTADPTEVALRRRDPALGDVVVHFPRLGFVVRAL